MASRALSAAFHSILRRRNVGHRRGIGLREKCHGAIGHAPAPGRARPHGGGEVLFDGVDLLALPEDAMRDIRGNRIAMIFQEPMTSLNPVLTIGSQIAEAVRIHQGADEQAARARAVEMLTLVRIPDAAQRLDDYPHHFPAACGSG